MPTEPDNIADLKARLEEAFSTTHALQGGRHNAAAALRSAGFHNQAVLSPPYNDVVRYRRWVLEPADHSYHRLRSLARARRHREN